MGFLSKLFKGVKKIAKVVAPIVVGSFAGPAAGALTGAALGAMGGGGIKGALTGGLTGYSGTSLINALKGVGALPAAGVIGPQIGTVSKGLGNLLTGAPGAFNAFTGGLTGGLGSATGFLQAISPLMSSYALKTQKIGDPDISAAEAPPFSPNRPDAMNRPQVLNEMAGFLPEQERAALATRGVNAGLGSEEDQYYRNLLQRSLIDEGNQVNTSNPNFLLPIESQYFSKKGIDTSNIMEFLRGIS